MGSIFDWLLDPGTRTFYGYWVSTLLIILIWASLQWHQRQHRIKQWFTGRYWWNTSTRQAYFWLFFNRIFFLTLGIAWFAFAIDVAQLTYKGLSLLGSPT